MCAVQPYYCEGDQDKTRSKHITALKFRVCKAKVAENDPSFPNPMHHNQDVTLTGLEAMNVACPKTKAWPFRKEGRCAHCQANNCLIAEFNKDDGDDGYFADVSDNVDSSSDDNATHANA